MNRRLGSLTLLTVMLSASFITLAATPAEAAATYHLRQRVKRFFERAKHPTTASRCPINSK